MTLNASLLKLPGIRRLLTGYGLSVIADTSVYIVFALWAKQLTGSTSDAGLVFFCFIIPSLIAPITGNAIDSLKKDSIMVFTNLFMAASILTLQFAHEKYQFILLLTSAFIYGLGYVVFNSARVCLVVNNYEEKYIYPSYFKLHVRWLHSFTRITYACKLIGILSLAAFLQLELFWV